MVAEDAALLGARRSRRSRANRQWLLAVRAGRAQPAPLARRASQPLRRRYRRAGLHAPASAGPCAAGGRRDMARRRAAIRPRLGATQAGAATRRLTHTNGRIRWPLPSVMT